MNKIETFLTIEISNLNDDLRRQWEYLSDEVQYRKLDNIEPFLIHIRKLEARKTHLNMMIERARANES